MRNGLTANSEWENSVRTILAERAAPILEKFENGWLDCLIEKWWGYYYKKQNEAEKIVDPDEFKSELKSQIQECIAFMEKYLSWSVVKNDYAECFRIHCIKEKYKLLFYDETVHSEKETKFINRLGFVGRVFAQLPEKITWWWNQK